jgi:predicted ATPase
VGERRRALVGSVLAELPPYVRRETGRLVPELAPDDSAGPLGPGEGWERERLFTALRELLNAVSRRRPAVLVVEDVHWADRTTLELLSYLAGSRTRRVPLVVTSRHGDMDHDHEAREWLLAARSLPGVMEVRLSPLTRDETEAQVIALTGGRPAGAVIDALYARSEGNPFFTEQLVAATPLGGAADRRPRGSLPIGLAELLTSRARRATGAAREVLDALSVAARPLDDQALAAVSGVSGEVLDDALGELVQTRLVTSAVTGGHRARHALLAEAVEGDLPPHRRRALHACVADTLAALGEAAPAAEVAAHWAVAQDAAAELRWTVRAAKAAEGVHAFAEAARHWERAIRLCEEVDRAEWPPGLHLPQLYVRAIDNYDAHGDDVREAELAEEGLARLDDDAADYDRAVALSRAAGAGGVCR